MVIEFLRKKKRFNQIIRDIKSVKIQGARNIARAAFYAYLLFPSEKTKLKLLSLRPTEPMLQNILKMAKNGVSYKEIEKHFDEAQDKINKNVLKLIKDQDIIFTHCHSTNVVNSLIYAKEKGIKFQVYNTETRPLFQGRRTARDLSMHNIKVTMFIDDALASVLSGEFEENPSKIFIGADALTKEGIVNKIGSQLISKIARIEKIPVYIIADSWKFTKKKISMEKRELNEVWNNAPKNVKIENPAFEFVPKEYISGIVSEFGILSYDKFVKKVS